MKTRFAYITLSVIAALVLSSCDKTEIGKDETFEPNFTINLGFSSQPGTKTSGTAEDAMDYEKSINTVRIFFAKANANGVPDESAKVVEVAQKDMSRTTLASGIKIDAKVFGLQGNYQLAYALVNCPDGLTIKTDTYAEFIGSYSYVNKTVLDNFWKVTYSTTDPAEVESGSFFMVNGVDSNIGSKNNNGGVFVDFSSTTSATINLERLAAKIVADEDDYIDFSSKRQKVYGDDDSDAYIVSSARIDAWALMNCVNSFNLIQKYSIDKIYNKNTSSEDNYVVNTPSSSNEYPWSKIDASRNFTPSTGYYFTNPASATDNNGNPTYTELEFVPAGSALYCIENNPDYFDNGDSGYIKYSGKTAIASVSDSKMSGRCTAVIFRAQLLLANGFESDITIDENLGKDPDKGEWDRTPTRGDIDSKITATIYSYRSKLYKSLTRLKTDNPSVDITSVETLRSSGVKVYVNGYMYYTYYIAKNDLNSLEPQISPYYCVERNKSYKLTVMEVKAFGDELPCNAAKYDPEDPIDRAVARITVSVDVLPWDSTANQTTEIKTNY